MALSTGSRIGHYEIVDPLGAGGMGEVYRARDVRLGREVALKVLPEVFAGDPERLSRFQREARTLAALNHPHIAQLHGFEDDGSTRAIVMELVDGQTLAERIRRGPLPVAEALAIARQIGAALDAAHQQGIVHRDLKPANIKLRDDGTVKVLDFGLAKALDFRSAERGAAAGARESPTITTPAMTLQGVILGTAAYMAPEQAKGKGVDKRADIWAFGCVLYEMVTGRRAFAGEDVSDTLAAVLRAEVDWSGVPPSILRLVKKCLERDPGRRLHDIGDAWDLIDDSPHTVAPSRSSAIAWAAAAVFLLTTIGLAFVHFRERPPELSPVRFELAPPPEHQFDIYLALSPDGRRIAFTARDAKGVVSLWVRDLGSLQARRLPGTEGAWSPFWSPDSRWLAFGTSGALKKIDTMGGPPQTLCEVQSAVGLGTWSRNGMIVFGARAVGPLRRVPDSGGVAVPLTAVESDTFHSFPAFLPDGKRFVYFRGASDRDRRGIYLGSVDGTPEQQSTTRIVESDLGPVHTVVTESGLRLFFLREQTVMSQAFDLDRGLLTGEPTPLVHQVGSSGSFAFFSTAGNVLAYRTGTALTTATGQLTWIDRKGQTGETVGEPNALSLAAGALALAPDATRAVVAIAPRLSPDLWLMEFERGIASRFTFNPAQDNSPIWSPDGSRIVFASNREGRNDLYVKNVDGSADETPLLRSTDGKTPTHWSSDAQYILFTVSMLRSTADLWILPVSSPERAVALLSTSFAEGGGRFSPDGRWIAYMSNESGRSEIYLRPFTLSSDGRPAVGAKWQVSPDGGTTPRWRRDGRELLYRTAAGAIASVEVTVADGTVRTGRPQLLFTLPGSTTNWDVTPDGQRFLVSAPVTAAPNADPITIDVNWQAGARR